MKNYAHVEEGTHMAVLVSVIDCGEHYNNFSEKEAPMVRLGFEIPWFTKKNSNDIDVPVVLDIDAYKKMISAYSSEKATLTPFLEALNGKKLTAKQSKMKPVELLGTLIGKGCMVAVVEKTFNSPEWDVIKYNRIAKTGVAALPKSMEVPEFKSQTQFFWTWASDASSVYQDMPDFIKEGINYNPWFASEITEDEDCLPF